MSSIKQWNLNLFIVMLLQLWCHFIVLLCEPGLSIIGNAGWFRKKHENKSSIGVSQLYISSRVHGVGFEYCHSCLKKNLSNGLRVVFFFDVTERTWMQTSSRRIKRQYKNGLITWILSSKYLSFFQSGEVPKVPSSFVFAYYYWGFDSTT